MSLLKTARAALPLLARAITSGRIIRPRAFVNPPIPDIASEYDVEVPVSDGTAILINVFKSRTAIEQRVALPVVMCAHPYDNHNIADLEGSKLSPPIQYRIIDQQEKPEFSSQTSWESPDPNFWVSNGYIVVNMNLPGFGGSTGAPGALRNNQSKAFYETIEWVAAQAWCDGNVGLCGVSFLAISQYHVAACRDYGFKAPPSLKCIAPWEGLTDAYRDVFSNGGIPQIGFPAFWWELEVKSSLTGTPEDFLAVEGSIPAQWGSTHPLFDEFWEEKRAPVEHIDVPILTCVSFSDVGLHGGGAYRAFTDVASKQRWMYTHRDGKWDSFYSDDVKALLLKFMDHFLKGIDNGMDQVPPVRLEVRSDRTTIHDVRYESNWPLDNTEYKKLYLNPNRLTEQPSVEAGSITYDARKGEAAFQYTFEAGTEITGHAKLCVYISGNFRDPTKTGDMDLFAVMNKLDSAGKRVPFNGTVGNQQDTISRGYQRASLRKLDKARSTEAIPYLAFDEVQALSSGETVELVFPFPPTSVFFSKGESLELTLSSYETFQAAPFYKESSGRKGDQHSIQLGGNCASYLQVPVIPIA